MYAYSKERQAFTEICVSNLRIVPFTSEHTMVLCRYVHHSHTLRSSELTAPISKLGNLNVWTFVCMDGSLYYEKKNAPVAGALSPMLPSIWRDEAREALTLYSGMTADTVRGSGHNGTLYMVR